MKKVSFLFLTLCLFAGIVHGDITWDTPVTISTPATDASDPKVVIDTDGNATAIWVENNIIKASSLPFGGSWDTPVSISDVLNTSSTPRLKIDGSGNVTALWIENTLLKTATLPFGGSWSAATTISGAGATSPTFAVADNGNALAVWVRSGFIEAATRVSGIWSLVSVISTSGADNPDVAISNFGTGIAAWHNTVSGADVIVTNIVTVTTNTWGTSKNVFNGTASVKHNHPRVALDANGNAAVIWNRYTLLDGTVYQNVQVLSSVLPQGSAAWGSLASLSSGGIRNPADLKVKLSYDINGNLLAVWTNSYDGETFTIESALRPFGGTFSSSVSFSTPSIYSFSIDLAVASGTALVTNMAWDDVSSIVIQSQESDMTNPLNHQWTVTNPFSTGDSNAYPKCALSISGGTINAVAVWISFDGSNVVINAATGTGTVIDPPSNVAATQSDTDFGVYTDYFNTITWDASSDPNLIQYNIYRDGVYFASTDTSTLEFIDNNQIQGGTVTYGIGALTSDFRQSEIVTYTLFP